MNSVPKFGTRIRLVAMPDDPDPVPSGTLGTVKGGARFPEWCQVWVTWDNGRTLSLTVPPDAYEIVSDGA